MKRWLGNLALVFGGVVVALLLAEIGLRVAGIGFPRFTTPDEHRGYAHLPGAEGWWRKEGNAYIRINSDGLRDRERNRQKPSGVFRIAVLGDSVAEAFQLPLEDAFVSVVERELTACPRLEGRRVEVINFGVSGYGTAQELLTLRHHVWAYDPDLVLLAFTTANDVMNNSKILQADSIRPYFVFQDGELVLDESYHDSRRYRLRKTWLYRLMYEHLIHYSRVFQVVDEMRRRTFFKTKRKVVAEKAGVLEEAGLNTLIYKEPESEVWREAWQVTEALLGTMAREVWENGAGFLVVTLDIGSQVYPDVALRLELMDSLSVPDLFYPGRRIEALGQREGFTVLDLAPALQAYADRHGEFLHGFENTRQGTGHPNAIGHRESGKLMAAAICSGIGLPESIMD